MQPGVLYASGLIAGGAICAIAIAVISAAGGMDRFNLGQRFEGGVLRSRGLALLMFLGLCGLLWRRGLTASQSVGVQGVESGETGPP